MSVIKNKRNESKMQFLETANEIHLFTIKQAVKFPKKYTFYVSQKLSDCACAGHAYVKRGNSIYPTNAHEVQLRRDYFLHAYAEFQNLISQINIAYNLFPIPEKTIVAWMGLINDELRLLKSVLKNDKARYKNLTDF